MRDVIDKTQAVSYNSFIFEASFKIRQSFTTYFWDAFQQSISNIRKNFQYKTEGDLDRHLRAIHLDERPFVCSFCKHGFNKKSNLVKHIRMVHERIRPHQCEQVRWLNFLFILFQLSFLSVFLALPSQDIFLPHPIEGQGGSILLVHYSMIILEPAIFGTRAVFSYYRDLSRLLCLTLEQDQLRSSVRQRKVLHRYKIRKFT